HLAREDAVLFEQGAHIGLPAAKLDEGSQWIAGAATAQYGVEEALRRAAIEHPALLEGGEGIRRQHLGPLVAVVAGGITARENVPEAVRQPVPLRHRHQGDLAAHLRQSLGNAPAALRLVLAVYRQVEQ